MVDATRFLELEQEELKRIKGDDDSEDAATERITALRCGQVAAREEAGLEALGVVLKDTRDRCLAIHEPTKDADSREKDEWPSIAQARTPPVAQTQEKRSNKTRQRAKERCMSVGVEEKKTKVLGCGFVLTFFFPFSVFVCCTFQICRIPRMLQLGSFRRCLYHREFRLVISK